MLQSFSRNVQNPRPGAKSGTLAAKHRAQNRAQIFRGHFRGHKKTAPLAEGHNCDVRRRHVPNLILMGLICALAYQLGAWIAGR
jgi:hypothetical protein